MKLRYFRYLLIVLVCCVSFAQENDIFKRLSVLPNNGKIWYNIDGYSVTSEVFNYAFDEKGLKKVFRKHDIGDSDAKVKDNQVIGNNLQVSKQQQGENLIQNNSYYFVENSQKTITVVWFIKIGTTDKETEVKLVNAILENKIPKENEVPMKITSIGFAGRTIDLGSGCYWTFLNTVQCPYSGEMNWSVHRTLADAQQAIENQLQGTKSKKGAKVTSEEIVDVMFESVSTKAKKVVYNFTGVTSALAGMSGGKSMTVYYVAQTVRDRNVSCVMSFWNNDDINPQTKLPALLEQLMVLQ
jgi:hypothetical protein